MVSRQVSSSQPEWQSSRADDLKPVIVHRYAYSPTDDGIIPMDESIHQRFPKSQRRKQRFVDPFQ